MRAVYPGAQSSTQTQVWEEREEQQEEGQSQKCLCRAPELLLPPRKESSGNLLEGTSHQPTFENESRSTGHQIPGIVNARQLFYQGSTPTRRPDIKCSIC